MRSMALAIARIRRPPEPGSSGASGGRSDTIGWRGCGAGAEGLVGTGASAVGTARGSRNGVDAGAGAGANEEGIGDQRGHRLRCGGRTQRRNRRGRPARGLPRRG